jgi:hypothetical protein
MFAQTSRYFCTWLCQTQLGVWKGWKDLHFLSRSLSFAMHSITFWGECKLWCTQKIVTLWQFSTLVWHVMMDIWKCVLMKICNARWFMSQSIIMLWNSCTYEWLYNKMLFWFVSLWNNIIIITKWLINTNFNEN